MTLSAEAIAEIRRPLDDVRARIQSIGDVDGLFFHEEALGDSVALKAHDLEAFLPNPRRKKGRVILNRLDDFVTYVQAHGVHAVVFANRDHFQFTAYLNYHAPNAAGAGGTTPAGWADHVAIYRVQDTPEWASWKDLARRDIDQDAFAEFLEDHLVDITRPDAQALFETVTDLRLRSGAQYERALRLANGTVQFTYREEVAQQVETGQIEIPERLTLALQLWEGEVAKTELVPRLRHRLSGGKVRFHLIFGDDVERMLRDRFNQFAGAIEQQLDGVSVLFGERVN